MIENDEELREENTRLRMMNNFYSQIIDSVPFLIYVKNSENKLVYANKAFLDSGHTTLEKVQGKNENDFLPSEDLASKYVETDKKILETGIPSREIQPVFFGGKYSYADVIKNPIKNKDNEVQSLVEIIVPNKKDEEKDNFQSPNLLFDYYLESKEISVLNNLEGFNAISSGKLSIDYVRNRGLIDPEDLDNLISEFHKIYKGKEIPYILAHLFNDKGERIPFKIAIKKVLDSDEKIVRISCKAFLIQPENYKAETMKIEYEYATKQLNSILGLPCDVSLYVNVENNYFLTLVQDEKFGFFPEEGEWNNFVEIMYANLFPSDYGILKLIFSELENKSGKIQNHDFRFSDHKNGFRWKTFRVDNLEVKDSKGFMISIFDVNDAVISREQRNLKEINGEIIDVLSTVVEFRDMESGGHVKRIKQFTRILLKTATKIFSDINYTHEEIEVISIASAMHDIGKIAIPDSILLKPGRLTPEEFEIMKTHTVKGCEILASMPKIQEESYYKYSYEICRHHHERYDGKGYPDHLVGDEISFEAQIVSLADCFDALTNERCYKPPYPYDKAFEMIMAGECGAFSSRLLECFKYAFSDMKEFAKTIGNH